MARRYRYALICGRIRGIHEAEFLVRLALGLQVAGHLDRVVVSTWREEVERLPDFFRWAVGAGASLVATAYAPLQTMVEAISMPTMTASTAAQTAQIEAGLDLIRRETHGRPPQDVLVWKLRTDKVVSRVDAIIQHLPTGHAESVLDSGRFLVLAISTLELFDINDITFVSTLDRLDGIARLSFGSAPSVADTWTVTEAEMFGARAFATHPVFAIYRQLSQRDRVELRRAILAQFAAGADEPALSGLVALYLRDICATCSLADLRQIGPQDFAIDDLFIPRGLHGVDPYRACNTALSAQSILQRLGAGRISGGSPFGEAIAALLRAPPRVEGIAVQLMDYVSTRMPLEPYSVQHLDRHRTDSMVSRPHGLATADFLDSDAIPFSARLTARQRLGLDEAGPAAGVGFLDAVITRLCDVPHDTSAAWMAQLAYWSEMLDMMGLGSLWRARLTAGQARLVGRAGASAPALRQWLASLGITPDTPA